MEAREAPKLFQGVERENFAFKMLKKLGWEEGKGLGKEKQGISRHIHVRKNFENSGVGLAEAQAVTKWQVNTAAYDNILANLKVKHNIVKEEPADQPSDGADEVKKSKSKKRKVTEAEKEDSETEQEKERQVKVAKPQGRYKKREHGKLVKHYSSEDLTAILGGQAPAAPLDPSPLSKASPAVEGDSGDGSIKDSEALNCGPDAGPKKKSKNKLSVMPSAQPVTKSIANKPAAAAPSSLFASLGHPTPVKPTWWGHSFGFVKGGGLGVVQPKPEVVPAAAERATAGEKVEGNGRVAFHEDDQEKLYNLVQTGATSGKQGLGIASRPKKVAGARFAGTKVTFDNSDSEPEGEEAQPSTRPAVDATPAEDSVEEPAEKGKKRKKMDKEAEAEAEVTLAEAVPRKKRRKSEQIEEQVEEERVDEGGAQEGEGAAGLERFMGVDVEVLARLKWRKLIGTALLEKSAGRGARLAKLRRQVAAAAREKLGPVEVPENVLEAYCEQQARRSSRFVVEGDRVYLASVHIPRVKL